MEGIMTDEPRENEEHEESLDEEASEESEEESETEDQVHAEVDSDEEDFVLADLGVDQEETEPDEAEDESLEDYATDLDEQEEFDQEEQIDEEEAAAEDLESEETEEVQEPQEEMVPLKVFGETEYAPLSKVLDAGIRTLQKQSAADKYLEEARRTKKEAEEYLERIRAGEIPDAQEPSEETAGQPTPQLDPEEAAKIQRRFAVECGDIVEDPYLFRLTTSLVNEKLAAGEPNVPETYVAAGKEVRAWVERRVMQKLSERDMETRLQRKREAARWELSPVNARHVPQAPEPKADEAAAARTEAQRVLEEMAKARGQRPPF
ncbi:MAG: hypothetical protein JRJ03_08770 [Deltaproteobacteria bacterium]|nr:hypothetical protein [Deltaproteobacteria bacterium]